MMLLETATSWREILRGNFTRLGELATYLELSEENRARLRQRPRFALNLPRRLAQKIEKNTLTDPLFRQFVPLLEEEEERAGFVSDPVCDGQFQKGPKILHKYQGRALVLTTSACAMHCRYCFRQHFPYDKGAAELGFLRDDPSIEEVILSGGDPLSLSDLALAQLFRALEAIPHIRRIRFHTRFPIGIPERIDAPFLRLLSSVQKQLYFVVHCNHPRELDPEVLSALRQVGALGIPLLNQSVLLKGVNDDEGTFLELCRALVNGGILPYYLHVLDPVQGAAHFDLPASRGHALIEHVRQHLSGYGVPRLVKEEAGAPSKTFL